MASIVIVNYKNDGEVISFVHDELARQKGIDRIVVVNNGVEDVSSSALADALGGFLVCDDCVDIQDSRIYVLNVHENLGYAKGNNLGFSFIQNHFGSRYVLFSNPDVKIGSPELICSMEKILEADGNIGVLGPKVIGLDGGLQSPAPWLPFWTRYVTKPLFAPLFSADKKKVKFRTGYAEDASEGPVDMVMGSFFMVRSEDFSHCGMFDPNTFLYYEEYILSSRMRRIGKQVYYAPDLEVVHAHATTIKKYHGFLQMERLNLQSAKYYYGNYCKTPAWILAVGGAMYMIFNRYRAFKMKIR